MTKTEQTNLLLEHAMRHNGNPPRHYKRSSRKPAFRSPEGVAIPEPLWPTKNRISIYFDGGCRPHNPGNKYGSWEVLLDGRQVFKASRVEFGYGTNNEAEFNSMIAALQWTVENLFVGGFEPSNYTVELFTDSTIVKNRLKNRKTVIRGQENSKNRDVSKRMGNLTRECLSRLTLFRFWRIEWQRRDANVERFGH